MLPDTVQEILTNLRDLEQRVGATRARGDGLEYLPALTASHRQDADPPGGVGRHVHGDVLERDVPFPHVLHTPHRHKGHKEGGHDL